MPAGVTYDERTRLLFFATVDEPTDLAAITATELGDGVDLSGYLVDFNPNFGNSRVAGHDYLTDFDNESLGREQAAPTAVFKSKLRAEVDGADDLAYSTFLTRRTSGTFVWFNGTLTAGADPATGDRYIAFPDCECSSPKDQTLAENTEARFEIDILCGDRPVRGTVVAS